MRLGFVPLRAALTELRTLQFWTDILIEFYVNFIIFFAVFAVAINTGARPSEYNTFAFAFSAGL